MCITIKPQSQKGHEYREDFVSYHIFVSGVVYDHNHLNSVCGVLRGIYCLSTVYRSTIYIYTYIHIYIYYILLYIYIQYIYFDGETIKVPWGFFLLIFVDTWQSIPSCEIRDLQRDVPGCTTFPAFIEGNCRNKIIPHSNCYKDL